LWYFPEVAREVEAIRERIKEIAKAELERERDVKNKKPT